MLVIGAGFAGLSAAARLAGAGIAVTVLEATDAIGGRAKAQTVGDLAMPGQCWVGRRRRRTRCTRCIDLIIRALALPMQLPVAGPVELGATWFHGTVNNPVYDFAVAQGIISAGKRRSPTCAPQRGWAGVAHAPPQAASVQRAPCGTACTRHPAVERSHAAHPGAACR